MSSHLFHWKIFFLTYFTVWSLLVSIKFVFSANLTIILFRIWNAFQSITYNMKTCITYIAVYDNIILTIRATKAYFTVSLKFFGFISSF